MKNVCVYCSSSSAVAPEYVRAAEELGGELARRSWSLVYGGTRMGLMGALADAAQAGGACVIGVVPQIFIDQKFADARADELIATPDLRTRKGKMLEIADAVVALPGGFGTLDELMETITLKQLRLHAKAIVIINTGGYFDPLLAQLQRVFDQQFTHEDYRNCYFVAPAAAAAGDYLAAYQPPHFTDKWL